MIFLIEYDAPKGKIVTLLEFAEEDRLKAFKKRLDIELDLLRRGVKHEVVTLEARDKAAIMRTHGRYFKSVQELATEMLDAIPTHIAR